MAKVAKKTQTDYTRGGKAISDTSIPLYQENLNRMGEYLADPMAAQNKYLQEYFTNTPEQDDFLRNYNRAMSARTGQNYASTGGGYSSANQQGYDDLQRYMDDYAARLRQQGVTSAYNMASQDYANMLNGNASYHNAYGLGKEYSDIEQYNYMVDQANGNWLSNGMSTVGGVLQAIPTPWTQAIGAGLNIAGNATKVDVPLLGGSDQGGAGTSQFGYLNQNQAGALGTALEGLYGKAKTAYQKYKNKNNALPQSEIDRMQNDMTNLGGTGL